MSDVSKTTSNHMKILGYAQHSIDDQLKPEADAIARALFGPNPPEKITIPELVDALSGRLAYYKEAEEEADIALVTDGVETGEARGDRNDVHEEFLDDLRSYRNALGTVYGARVQSRFGMSSPPPKSAQDVERYARKVVRQMRAHKLDEKPRKGFQAIDVRHFADLIEESLAALSVATEDVSREVREDERARAHRDQIRAEGWQSYQGIVTIAEGCFRLIGRNDMADRVRLTSRRAKGMPEPVDELYDETGEEPAPEPALASQPEPEPA